MGINMDKRHKIKKMAIGHFPFDPYVLAACTLAWPCLLKDTRHHKPGSKKLLFDNDAVSPQSSPPIAFCSVVPAAGKIYSYSIGCSPMYITSRISLARALESPRCCSTVPIKIKRSRYGIFVQGGEKGRRPASCTGFFLRFCQASFLSFLSRNLHFAPHELSTNILVGQRHVEASATGVVWLPFIGGESFVLDERWTSGETVVWIIGGISVWGSSQPRMSLQQSSLPLVVFVDSLAPLRPCRSGKESPGRTIPVKRTGRKSRHATSVPGLLSLCSSAQCVSCSLGSGARQH